MKEHEPTDGEIPSKEWPSEGAISLKNLSVRYAEDLPDVLHDVSLHIEVSCLVASPLGRLISTARDASRPCRLDRLRQIDSGSHPVPSDRS